MVNLAYPLEFAEIEGSLLCKNSAYLSRVELLTLANHLGNLVLKWNGHNVCMY